MEKLRHVEFWKAAQQVPTASWGAELLVEARAFLGPAHLFISWPPLRPFVPKDRERMVAFQPFQSHCICSLNVLRGGLKNIGLIIKGFNHWGKVCRFTLAELR